MFRFISWSIFKRFMRFVVFPKSTWSILGKNRVLRSELKNTKVNWFKIEKNFLSYEKGFCCTLWVFISSYFVWRLSIRYTAYTGYIYLPYFSFKGTFLFNFTLFYFGFSRSVEREHVVMLLSSVFTFCSTKTEFLFDLNFQITPCISRVSVDSSLWHLEFLGEGKCKISGFAWFLLIFFL